MCRVERAAGCERHMPLDRGARARGAAPVTSGAHARIISPARLNGPALAARSALNQVHYLAITHSDDVYNLMKVVTSAN
ncbi:unnamed protein product [Arctia plantaginis]|uniref:Uncharacterized protein n=1 Tax=Arctia plantaginis TaxID=874455 RepID=A0A8S1AAF5_ARCPL|nr:unnamed protein product [Arctia plantaginis]